MKDMIIHGENAALLNITCYNGAQCSVGSVVYCPTHTNYQSCYFSCLDTSDCNAGTNMKLYSKTGMPGNLVVRCENNECFNINVLCGSDFSIVDYINFSGNGLTNDFCRFPTNSPLSILKIRSYAICTLICTFE